MTIKKAEQSIVPIILRKPNGIIIKEAGRSIVPRKPYTKKICNNINDILIIILCTDLVHIKCVSINNILIIYY